MLSRRICGQIAAVSGDFRGAKQGDNPRKPSPKAGRHLADVVVASVQDGEDRLACGAFQKHRDRRPSVFTSPILHVVTQGGVDRGFAGIEALNSAIRMPLHSGGEMVEIHPPDRRATPDITRDRAAERPSEAQKSAVVCVASRLNFETIGFPLGRKRPPWLQHLQGKTCRHVPPELAWLLTLPNWRASWQTDFRLALIAPNMLMKCTGRPVESGIELSVGSMGNSCGNTRAETIIGLFRAKVIHRRGPWRSFKTVECATLEWVYRFNNRRLHEPVENIPLAEAEAPLYADLETEAMAAQPASGKPGALRVTQ